MIPAPPAAVPNYLSALNLNFVSGKKIGYNGTLTPGTPLATAYNALVAAGAIMVPRPQATVGPMPGLAAGYESHKTIDEYYKRLGPAVPIHSLVEEVADNQANAEQALKFGNNTHLNNSTSDISAGGANETQYRTNPPQRKAAWHKAIDDMMTYTNSDPTQPADPVIAILGSAPSTPQAGYPQGHGPDGLQRHHPAHAQSVGVGYVIEQATKLRQPASAVNPSMYRCAKTVPSPPYASRGGCNPDYDLLMALAGGSAPSLPFALETETVQSLQARQTAGTLSAETLTKAYLARIAVSNAEGPGHPSRARPQPERRQRRPGAGPAAVPGRPQGALVRHPCAGR